MKNKHFYLACIINGMIIGFVASLLNIEYFSYKWWIFCLVSNFDFILVFLLIKIFTSIDKKNNKSYK